MTISRSAPPRRNARRRVAVAAAAAVVVLGGGCGKGGDEAGAGAAVSTRSAAAGPAGTEKPRRCAITAGCALPDPPRSFEVGTVPDGWTVRDSTADAGTAMGPGTLARDLVAPDGRVLRILLFPMAPGPVPTNGTHSPVAIGGGLTAYVSHQPVGKGPDEDVHVAVKPAERLGILATARGVPEDVVLTAVASIAVS